MTLTALRSQRYTAVCDPAQAKGTCEWKGRSGTLRRQTCAGPPSFEAYGEVHVDSGPWLVTLTALRSQGYTGMYQLIQGIPI